MKARPILMHGRSIRSILAGRKTQTRRIIAERERIGYSHDEIKRADASGFVTTGGLEFDWRCPKGQPGDLLYARETHYVWSAGYIDGTGKRIDYRATEPDAPCTWTPSIHMPRWASRLTLHLTDVRVERVQQISAADCEAEGCSVLDTLSGYHREAALHTRFIDLWDQTNGKGAYERNDWCWVLCFEVIEANVDDVLTDPARYGIGEAA